MFVCPVILLLVAAVIGFFTAWFYSKSVYTPIVKNMEDEKVQLTTQIASLKDDAFKLTSEIEQLNDKVSKLENKQSEKEK